VRGLDTNVLARYLTQDEPAQARLASKCVKECSSEQPCLINRIVLCELVWVLESAYGYRRAVIADVLDRILRTAQFEVEDLQACWSALESYRASRADFADALLGGTNRMLGCETTMTFDQDAAKLPDFELLA
jgi:predicted nucleic-acid-binding protein